MSSRKKALYAPQMGKETHVSWNQQKGMSLHRKTLPSGCGLPTYDSLKKQAEYLDKNGFIPRPIIPSIQTVWYDYDVAANTAFSLVLDDAFVSSIIVPLFPSVVSVYVHEFYALRNWGDVALTLDYTIGTPNTSFTVAHATPSTFSNPGNTPCFLGFSCPTLSPSDLRTN